MAGKPKKKRKPLKPAFKNTSERDTLVIQEAAWKGGKLLTESREAEKKGNTPRAQKLRQQAIKQFETALKHDPEEINALLGFADIYEGRKDYATAEKYLRRAEEAYWVNGVPRKKNLNISSTMGIYILQNLGACLVHQGKYEDAITYLEKARISDRGEILKEKSGPPKEKDRKQGFLNNLSMNQRFDLQINSYMAIAQLKLQRYVDAEISINRARKIYSSHAGVIALHITCSLLQNKFDEAFVSIANIDDTEDTFKEDISPDTLQIIKNIAQAGSPTNEKEISNLRKTAQNLLDELTRDDDKSPNKPSAPSPSGTGS